MPRKMVFTDMQGILRRTALILRRIIDGKIKWYGYDRHTKVCLASSWRKGRLKQVLREMGYRWP